MKCMNCGTFLAEPDLEYCPKCGSNVMIQKKIIYLSRLYYNRGLEKATVRDLSGAITCLKQSLTYDKTNTQARNLLGLVYFETGEVVAALSEWVISKSLQPNKNLAVGYIDQLQANTNKLNAINETIRRYNEALALCRQGHEDMAAIQLKKILTQNPKLIKGYHLLALIQIKGHEWTKARRTLKKAIRIDTTNTTTLRFLREIDERTGLIRSDASNEDLTHPGRKTKGHDILGMPDYVLNPPAYKENSRFSLFFTLAIGIAIGVAAFNFLVLPALKQRIYKEANNQIVKYSESTASQSTDAALVQNSSDSNDSITQVMKVQVEEAQRKAQSYKYLMLAYYASLNTSLDEAALDLQNVYESVLDETSMGLYTTLCQQTGVTGIQDDSQPLLSETETTTQTTEEETTTQEEYSEESYDTESYDGSENYDESYEDGSGEDYLDYTDEYYDSYTEY